MRRLPLCLMMRNTILILITCILLGCNSRQGKTKFELTNTELNDSKSNLNGIWGLNNYFNKILSDKEIAKHRVQAPSWFAILLEIKNDSITSYGSITELKEKLNHNSDTLTIFESFGGKYALIKKSDKLHLKQYKSQDTIDSITYTFSKRNDLKILLENQKRVYGISNNITTYFNEKLVSGTYYNLNNNEMVTFEKNGELKNFNGFDKYEVRNYFGTLHPHKNLDVITLTDSKQNTYKQFNWKFKDDKLILTEFIHETIEYKGKKEKTDGLVLGNNIIELKLKNH